MMEKTSELWRSFTRNKVRQSEATMKLENLSTSEEVYGKGVCCHLAYFLCTASTSCARLNEARNCGQWRLINNLRYADDTVIISTSKENLKKMISFMPPMN